MQVMAHIPRRGASAPSASQRSVHCVWRQPLPVVAAAIKRRIVIGQTLYECGAQRAAPPTVIS
jgi:hypothetical protein